MELKVNSGIVYVNPADQPDAWLVSTAQEIADAANERGLKLPFASGVVAVERAMQSVGHNAVTLPTRESLSEQLSTAYAGYQVTTGLLNEGRSADDQIQVIEPEALKDEFDTWLTDKKVAYIAAAQEADREVHFTLVATSNVVISDKELAHAAKAFGKNQRNETYVFNALYSRYAPVELSGTDPSNGKGVVFSLIPSKYTPGMDGTVAEQRAKLAQQQADTPGLKVPSPLEAVTYWQTLLSAGEIVADDTAYELTHIRHFDLPEQPIGDFEDLLRVPSSFVNDNGMPALSRSAPERVDHGRVAVG